MGIFGKSHTDSILGHCRNGFLGQYREFHQNAHQPGVLRHQGFDCDHTPETAPVIFSVLWSFKLRNFRPRAQSMGSFLYKTILFSLSTSTLVFSSHPFIIYIFILIYIHVYLFYIIYLSSTLLSDRSMVVEDNLLTSNINNVEIT